MTCVVNVLEPLQIAPAGFDSIAINYLPHCLPGNIRTKAAVFQNLKSLLNCNSGVIFGTTILGKGIKKNFLAKAYMYAYNWKGIFANADDCAADLENVLKTNFHNCSMHMVGCVAFFVGRI